MPMNVNSNIIGSHKKLGTKPKWLNSNLQTSNSYQARAYKYNTLAKEITMVDTQDKFKKKNKDYMMEHDNGFY